MGRLVAVAMMILVGIGCSGRGNAIGVMADVNVQILSSPWILDE